MTKPHIQKSSKYPESPDIEVLICTHNREELLERALASLNCCVRPDNCRTAIFVVANACSDGTSELLNSYIRDSESSGVRLPLAWMNDPIAGKSHALNTALPLASAPLVAFVDDDHRIDKGYLNAVWQASQSEHEADFFCGRILPDWDGTEPDWVHDEGRYRIYPLPVPRFDLGEQPFFIEPGAATPGGGNLAIRYASYEKNGPFDLDLGPRGHNLGGAEDIEWVRRGVAAGAKVYYVPDMLQYHFVESERMTTSYVMRKAYERSASTFRIAPVSGGPKSLPPYMVRKAIMYGINALISISNRRRRFYLTRLSAALGEIKGFRQHKKAILLREKTDTKTHSKERTG
ncbi:MAG: glycosyltransferase family A protein [Pseudomonadota bacterium]